MRPYRQSHRDHRRLSSPSRPCRRRRPSRRIGPRRHGRARTKPRQSIFTSNCRILAHPPAATPCGPCRWPRRQRPRPLHPRPPSRARPCRSMSRSSRCHPPLPPPLLRRRQRARIASCAWRHTPSALPLSASVSSSRVTDGSRRVPRPPGRRLRRRSARPRIRTRHGRACPEGTTSYRPGSLFLRPCRRRRRGRPTVLPRRPAPRPRAAPASTPPPMRRLRPPSARSPPMPGSHRRHRRRRHGLVPPRCPRRAHRRHDLAPRRGDRKHRDRPAWAVTEPALTAT